MHPCSTGFRKEPVYLRVDTVSVYELVPWLDGLILVCLLYSFKVASLAQLFIKVKKSLIADYARMSGMDWALFHRV